MFDKFDSKSTLTVLSLYLDNNNKAFKTKNIYKFLNTINTITTIAQL